jgi:hypothetical protein
MHVIDDASREVRALSYAIGLLAVLQVMVVLVPYLQAVEEIVVVHYSDSRPSLIAR